MSYVSPEERRAASNARIKSQGIICYEDLPLVESSTAVKLKDLDAICRRAVACLLVIQVACDIQDGADFAQSSEMFGDLLKNFGASDQLLPLEQKVMANSCSAQELKDMVCTYESYWALMWALGMVDDEEMLNAQDNCDYPRAVGFVSDCASYDIFRARCKVRDIEEILNMVDLFYRYHWACVERSLNPEVSIDGLKPEVVAWRRRGLEWLIAPEQDWFEITLDT